MGVGKKIKRINSRSGKPVEGEMEVIECVPDQAATMVIHDGPAKVIARAIYKAEGDEKTLLTMKVEFPEVDEMDTSMLVNAMQASIRNTNQLLASESRS